MRYSQLLKTHSSLDFRGLDFDTQVSPATCTIGLTFDVDSPYENQANVVVIPNAEFRTVEGE